MRTEELYLVFQSLDDLHFDGLLRSSGWQIKSGCLHDGARPFSKPEGDSSAYVFHESVWGLTMPHVHTIVLDHRLLNEEPALRMVLLHEMAHAKVMTSDKGRKRRNAHGRPFVQELRRLVDRGEECLRPEVDFYAGSKQHRSGSQ
jgi:hypothetical protein